MANAPRRRKVKIDDSGADQIGEINPEAQIDSEKLVIQILNIISHEVTRLQCKSNSMILDLQESKLLESYLRGVLAAEEKLSFNKRKITEEERKTLSEAEILAMLKGGLDEG